MVDQLRAVKAEIGDAQAIHDLIFGIENGGHPHTPAKRGASDGGGLVVDQLRAVKAEIGDAQAIHDLIFGIENGGHPHTPAKGAHRTVED
jgi:hypothetical protein